MLSSLPAVLPSGPLADDSLADEVLDLSILPEMGFGRPADGSEAVDSSLGDWPASLRQETEAAGVFNTATPATAQPFARAAGEDLQTAPDGQASRDFLGTSSLVAGSLPSGTGSLNSGLLAAAVSAGGIVSPAVGTAGISSGAPAGGSGSVSTMSGVSSADTSPGGYPSIPRAPAGDSITASEPPAGEPLTLPEVTGTAEGDSSSPPLAHAPASFGTAGQGEPVELPGFDPGLTDWTVTEHGGSASPGRVVVQGNDAVIEEGDSFLVTLEHTFEVPQNASTLSFTYTDLSFDTTDPNFINDAFEAALVDGDGNSLIATIGGGRDVFFNISEEIPAALGSDATSQTTADGEQVTLDLSGVLPGETATLIFRLVNNDADTLTSVRILSLQTNQAPEIDPLEPISADEGQWTTLRATFTDEDVDDTHTAMIHWGDGKVSVGNVTEIDGQKTVTADHVYADNGTYTVGLEVTDAAETSDEAQTTATIANVAPELATVLGFETYVVADAPVLKVRFQGEFTDPGFNRPEAFTEETFTVTVDWGDGSVEAIVADVVQGYEDQLTRGTFLARHVYAPGSIYQATITVADDDEGEDQAEFRYAIAGVDVKPAVRNPVWDPLTLGGSDPSLAHGLIPVVIESTAQFDATRVDPQRLYFSPGAALEDNAELNPFDVDEDGRLDSVAHFSTWESRVRATDEVAFVSGSLDDGTYFVGVDLIPVTPASSRIPDASVQSHSDPSGTKFFVVDSNVDATFRYAPDGSSTGAFFLHTTVTDPRGATGNLAGDAVWTVDGATHQVAVHDPSGWYLGSWLALGLRSPEGIATDGTDIWIVDAQADSVLHYGGAASLRSVLANPSGNFPLHALNTRPTGIATDGGTLWVTDDVADAVFVYDTTGVYQGHWSLDSENADPSGITNNPAGGTDLWVVDREDRLVYQYATGTDLRDGSATATSTFILAATNTHPEGIADPPPRIWDYEEFSDLSAFTLNGATAGINAAGPVVYDGQPVLRLTDDYRQGGSAFLAEPIVLEDASGEFQASFSSTFAFQITDSGGWGGGADGLVFCVQTEASNVGGAGGGIGYSGIAPSVGIEFDTYNNGGPDGNNNNHVGIDLNGNWNSVARYHVPVASMKNGQVWHAWIDYDGASDLLEVRLAQEPERPDDPVLSYVVDLAYVLETPEAYVGFTSGTGMGTGDHDIRSWQFVNDYNPIGDYQVSLSASAPASEFAAGTTVLISGHAASVRDDGGATRQIVAASVDGIPVDALDGLGNFFTQVTVLPGKNVFELTAVDVGGQSAATTLILEGTQRPEGTAAELLFDVSPSFAPEYARTSFDESTDLLYADLAIRNVGQYPADAPLLVGVTNISDLSVAVRDAVGVTPDGIPYYDYTAVVPGGTLAPPEITGFAHAVFHNPDRTQFTYDLVFLAELNEPPAFTTVPVLEAAIDRPYRYDADAADPDDDPLGYSLVAGPTGLAINELSGEVTWTPGADDLGTHDMVLRVEDGRGGAAEQHYTLSVIETPPNRPPVFTSTGPIDASVNTAYRYDAEAQDADGDLLAFTLLAGPDGMTVDEQTGLIAWTPRADQLGTHSVRLEVDDDRGGIAGQAFSVFVGPDSDNHAPVITSDPITQLNLVRGTGEGSLVDLSQWSVGQYQLQNQPNANWVLSESNTVATQTVNADASVLLSDFDLTNDRIDGTWRVNTRSDDDFMGFVFGYQDPEHFYLFDWKQTDQNLGGWGFADAGMSVKVVDADSPLTGRDFWNTAGAVDQVETIFHNTIRWQDYTDYEFTLEFNTGEFTITVRQGDTVLESVTLQDDTYTSGKFGFYNFSQGQIRYSGFRRESLPPRVYQYDVDALEPDGDPLSYTLVESPPGMLIDADTGLIHWQVTSTAIGLHDVTVRVEDGRGGADEQTFALEVFDAGTSEIHGTKFNDLDGDGVQDGRNLLQNFDFEDGLANFTTDLTQGDMGSPGTFDLATDPHDHHGSWGSFGDHTSGSGLMMIVNGALQSNHAVWQQEVAVIPGAEYRFGVWAASTYADGPARIQFSVNGETIGEDLQLSSTVGQWQYLSADWFSGTATAATVAIRNYTDVFGGNDFALDDIQFATTDTPEPGLPDWIIYLDQNQNGRRDSGERSIATDADGRYDFSSLPPGTYYVAEEPRSGWGQTWPTEATPGAAVFHRVDLGEDVVVSAVDFGNIEVSGDNTAPYFTSEEDTSAIAGDLYRYDAAATDPDSDSLTFDLPTAPVGMTVHPQLGIVVWQPTLAQVGTRQVVLRVADGRGGVDLQSFQITVTAPNTPPVITSDPLESAVAGLPYVYPVRAQDGENDPLAFRLDTAPSGMVIDEATGELTWTPTAAQVAPHPVVIVVTDGRSGEASQSFTLDVLATAPNDPPRIISTPRDRTRLGQPYLYSVDALDPNGDPLTYHLDTAPAGMTIDAAGAVRWEPTADQFGSNEIILHVEDGRGGTGTQSYTLEVVSEASNSAPRIVSTPPLTALVGRSYQYDLAAEDPEGDAVTWSLDAAPTGMSIDPLHGTLRWTPPAEQAGPNEIVVRVQDALFATATQSFTIAVRTANLPPAIGSTPPVVAAVDAPYVYAVRVTDPENDPLTFALTDAPVGMTIDASTGLIQWTPTAGQVGQQAVALTVEDGQGGMASQSYVVEVDAEAPNRPPMITSAPQFSATVDRPYQYAVTAVDPEADTLTFSLEQAPNGMTIDIATGLVEWTPGATQQGAHAVTVVVTDPEDGLATQSFVVVAAANQAPSIVSLPTGAAMVGATYRYDIQAIDPEGDSLTFVLDAGPEGMAIDPLGRLRWTPELVDQGSHSIRITVADDYGASDTQSFDLVVDVDAEAPVVQLGASGSLVDIGGEVRFHVLATDNVGVETLSLLVDGSPVPLDSSGHAVVPFFELGFSEVVATATDAVGNTGTSDPWQVRVIDPLDTSGPQVDLISPAPGATITYLTDVVATVTDSDLEYWRVEYARGDLASMDHIADFDPDYVVLAEGTSEVTNEVVAVFDPTLLANNSYVLRVIAQDTNGNINAKGVTVGVSGDAKLGNFHMEFTDLSIPLAGIPIQINRVYDTLGAEVEGDFGYGWQLGIQDGDIYETVPVTDELVSFAATPFRVDTRVYVTNPEGRRVGFTFDPVPHFGLLGTYWTPRFTPDPGVTDTLEVDYITLTRSATGTFHFYLLGFAYNPRTYRLTTRDGTIYEYDQFDGLNTATDRNGNQLTFTETGIFHSGGESIDFLRDHRGRIKEIVGPPPLDGDDPVVLSYEYDVNRDLVAFTDQGDNVTRYTYFDDPAHFLDTITDVRGIQIFDAEFDADGRLTSSTDALGATTSQDFDPENRTGTITDAKGNVTTLLYDQRGNVLEETDPYGNTTYYEYADPHNPDLETKVINRRGFGNKRVYDERGNVISARDCYSTKTYEYTADNDVLAFTDQLGRKTTFNYDTDGNLTEIVRPNGARSSAEYDSLGRIRSLTDHNGNETEFGYETDSSPGWPNRITNADGTMSQVEYDQYGLATRIVDEDGIESVMQYNLMGLKVFERNGAGDEKTYQYDGQLLIRETLVNAANPSESRTTEYEYDAAGQLVREIDPEGGETRFEYDVNGNRTAVVDSVGNRTEFHYNALDRVDYEIDPLGKVTDYDYDAEGNRTKIVDRNGRQRTFEYDRVGRLVEETWWDAGVPIQSISYVYDSIGNLSSIADSDSAYTYTYDVMNRMTSVDNAGTPDAPHVVLSYEYDGMGNVIRVSDNLGVEVRSEYDTRNRLAARTWEGPGIDAARVDFQYTNSERVSRLERYADATGTDLAGSTDYLYDAAGRTRQITHRDAVDVVLAEYQYEYDFGGLLTHELRHGDWQAEYNHDKSGQLLDAVFSGSDVIAEQVDEHYRYDANGNRTDSHLHGNGYVVGTGNRLLSDGEFDYTYDAEGNLMRKTEIATGTLTEYTYDHRNRLLTAEERTSGGLILNRVEYTYDVLNRRIAKTVNGQTTHSVYDDANVWADFHQNGEIAARYLFAQGIDEILARYRPGEGTVWHLADRLGSVRDLVDADGTPISHIDFDSFGNMLYMSNAATADRFLFTGRELDASLSLYYFRARYYDPLLGRFTGQDPLGFEAGDGNLYRYVGNQVLVAKDPTGLGPLIDYADQTALVTTPAHKGYFTVGTCVAAIISLVPQILDLAITAWGPPALPPAHGSYISAAATSTGSPIIIQAARAYCRWRVRALRAAM